MRIDCSAPPDDETVLVAETVPGSTDAAACSTLAGLPYTERNFVVCVQRRERT